LTVESNNNAEFPNEKSFRRFGSKAQFAKRVLEYCQGKDDYNDVAALCSVALARLHDPTAPDNGKVSEPVGEVYLFKSGRYYKIGKTQDTVRRGSEIRIQLPEKVSLVHSIRTDDPSGIEAYWHRRFEPKRMNGEWFDLNSTDVKAFKRWRRIH